MLVDLPEDTRLMTEEPFGPLAPILPFSDLDDAISKANQLDYGLSAYAFKGSPDTAERLADEVQSGGICINTVIPAQPDTPFGGVKDSGYG